MHFFFFLLTTLAVAEESNSVQSFEDIVKILESQEIRNRDDLLEALPREFRENYILNFSTGSPHGATPDEPRVIVFSNDGKIVLTFSGGDASGDYFQTVEVRETLDSTKEAPRVIQFSSNQKEKPVIIRDPVSHFRHNPRKNCVSCHTDRFVRRWDSYAFWPRSYGSGARRSDSRNLSTNESRSLENFQATKGKQGIYRHLIGLQKHNILSLKERATSFTSLSFHRAQAALVNEIKSNPAIQQLRESILVAATIENEDEFTDFLPNDLVGEYENRIEDIRENIREGIKARRI